MEATVNNMKRAIQWRGGIGGIVMYSPFTGEEYSANPADYWDRDPDKVFVDSDGEPLILAERETSIVELEIL